MERWFEALAGFLEVPIKAERHGWSLQGDSDHRMKFVEDFITQKERKPTRGGKAPIFVAAQPSTENEWRNRLRLVERAAARQLTNAPVGFAASFANAKTSSAVVRLAFGLSLSFGLALRQRFTAYFMTADETCFVTAGDDALFAGAPSVSKFEPHRPLLRKAWPKLAAAAGATQQTYRDDPVVVAEIDRLRRSYAEELQCLERLYLAGGGKEARLLGDPPEEMKNDDAVEAEYVARLEDLIDRYRPRVLFEPLTVGVIEGWQPARVGSGRRTHSPKSG